MNSENISNFFSTQDKTGIDKIFNKLQENDEFELMFYNYKGDRNFMPMKKYLDMLEYFNKRNKIDKTTKLEKLTSLDINYSYTDLITYRITILNLESINKYIPPINTRNNHVIFKVLLSKYLKGDKDIIILKKTKNKNNIYDVDNLNFRVRMSKEETITKDEIKLLQSISEQSRNSITFRYKQRVSLIFVKDKKTIIQGDLTNTKTTKNINKLEQTYSTYELELEYQNTKPKKEHLDIIYKESTIFLKIFQQSNFIIDQTTATKVIQQYRDLLSIKESESALYGRRVYTLELQHVVDKIQNRYAITDKADGDRVFLIIIDKRVYKITDNLEVVNLGIELKTSKYDLSIIDGEYIFLPKHNRHIFMAFDCLIKSSKDLRNESSFQKRQDELEDIIKNCFIFNKQKGHEFKKYSGEYKMEPILKFHQNEMDKFLKNLYDDVRYEKQYPLIRKKYFMFCEGIQDNEIFKYSKLLWEKYLYDKTNTLYSLDGLIYNPLDQQYVVSVKDSKYLDYKWKPPTQNTIDFYIKFERDRETGEILTVYDNSRDEFIDGQPYKICNLYVGKNLRGIEKPVLFQERDKKYIANLFLKDNNIRDIKGDLIEDKTVVEFYYDNNPEIPEEFRWVPIKTRFDKTESIRRYGKKYGNYFDTANKIWRNIINPLLFEDIVTLSKDNMFYKYNNTLRSKIDHKLIISEYKENVYYQMKTNLAKPMRNFHNWIKSIVIYTNCNPEYVDNRHLEVLDLACGRGGDIMKFYYAKVKLLVGIDVDLNGIESQIDGALSRYKQLSKSKPGFPRMVFIHADATVPLNNEAQNKALGYRSPNSNKLMEEFFSKEPSKQKKFDRVNCQFAIHYFLESKIKWENFCTNLNQTLKKGGYFLTSCFDASRIVETLGDEDNFITYYTNNKGEKKKLFEIKKKYDNIDKNKVIGIGNSIDVHNAFISHEDVYLTEYLVERRFLEKELLERCGLELVETDLFDNQFEIHREYFNNYIKYENVKETRNFLSNVSEFYNQEDNINQASFSITRLNRFYIFRKKD